MIHFHSWIRRVYPNDGYLLAGVSVCLIPEIVNLVTSSMPVQSDRIFDPPVAFTYELGIVLHRINVAFVMAGMVGLAVSRVWAFHPLFRPEYRRWLLSTPWTANLSLPNGPVLVSMQDTMLVLAGTLLIWSLHPEIAAYHIVLTFLFCYEAALAASMAILRMRRHAYSAAFGLGLVVALWSQTTAVWALLAAALVYFDLQSGLRRSLSRLEEWAETPYDSFLDQLRQPEARKQRDRSLGWPLEALRPDRTFFQLSAVDGLRLSLLAGWWANSLILAFQREDSRIPAMGLSTFFLLLVACGRLGIYLGGFVAPISLAGRIATGRWIIPGFDRAFLMPLASIAILSLFGFAQRRYEFDPRIMAACMTAAALAPLLMGGPELRLWQLTGGHRMTPVLSNSKGVGTIRIN